MKKDTSSQTQRDKLVKMNIYAKWDLVILRKMLA